MQQLAQDHSLAAAGVAKPVIFFDDVCIMCNSFVNLMLRIDRRKQFLFASLRGETASKLLPPLPDDPTTWLMVYVDESGIHDQSDASLEVYRRLGGLWWFLSFARFIPRDSQSDLPRDCPQPISLVWQARCLPHSFRRRESALPRLTSGARRMTTNLLTVAVFFMLGTPGELLAPWGSMHDPADVAKRHVQEIAGGKVEYVVIQGGTMDGRNCRSPQGVWQPFEQTWESNRSVRMENVGSTDVVNPWLSNGHNDFRSLDRIVARAIDPGMTDSEKARALWWQEVQHRFHLEGDNDELLDPVKVFNVYGHNTCGNDSICLAGLWRARLDSRSRRRAWWGTASPRSITMARGTSWTAICTDLPAARQRDRRRRAGPGARSRPDPPHPYSGNLAARQSPGG